MELNVIRLPWYRESAFKAWVKNSLSTLVIAIGAIQTNVATWQATLTIAALSIVKDFVGSAYDIFVGGPDVYQEPPADVQLATLKAEFDKYKAEHP